MTKVGQQAKRNDDGFLIELFHHNTTVMSEVRRFGKPQPNKRFAESSNLRRVIAAEQLYQTVDGYGLRSFVNAVAPSEWLEDGVVRMPTQKFLQYIMVHNKLRSARKNPMAKITCDAGCEEVECLDHIVQNCHRTNGPRHARHDAIVRMLENRLKEKGYITKLEPRNPTALGMRIPDLCSWSRSEYIVCDVEVIKDTFGLDRWHEFKVNKYDKPDIHRWVEQNNPIANAERQKGLITALILNWRGAVSLKSWGFWKTHDVTRRLLMWMSIKVLQETYKIWKFFKHSTWRKHGRKDRRWRTKNTLNIPWQYFENSLTLVKFINIRITVLGWSLTHLRTLNITVMFLDDGFAVRFLGLNKMFPSGSSSITIIITINNIYYYY